MASKSAASFQEKKIKIKFLCKYKKEWAKEFPANSISGDPHNFTVYRVLKMSSVKNKEEVMLYIIVTLQNLARFTTKTFELKLLALEFRSLRTHRLRKEI